MGNSDYVEIDIPDIGVDGYTKTQTDLLLSQIARSSNFQGKQLSTLDREIFGHKGYPGLKSETYATKKKIAWLTWLVRLLIMTAVGEGATIGVMGAKMLNGGL